MVEKIFTHDEQQERLDIIVAILDGLAATDREILLKVYRTYFGFHDLAYLIANQPEKMNEDIAEVFQE